MPPAPRPPPPPAAPAAPAAAAAPIDYTELMTASAEEHGLTQFALAFTLPHHQIGKSTNKDHQDAEEYAQTAIVTRMNEYLRTVSNGTNFADCVTAFFPFKIPNLFVITTNRIVARSATGHITPFTFAGPTGIRYSATIRAHLVRACERRRQKVT